VRIGDVRESCALRLSSYGIYVRERERWARSMRTCALALRVRERNKYILMTSEKIYSNLSSIADEAGTRLSHGGHLAQHGDGAIPRARAGFKHLGACVSSEARACGQKRVTRLHGRLQTGACGPAKGCCPIHKCGADAAVVCTPPQPRGNDLGGPVQPPCRHANHASSNSFKAGSATTFRTGAGEDGARSQPAQLGTAPAPALNLLAGPRTTLERTLLHHRRQRLAEDRTTKSKPVGFQLR